MEQEAQKDDCMFCQIAAGATPTNKIYEDEHTLAFLDIRPVSPGHALVIPKLHTPNIYEAPDEVLAHLLPAAKKVSKAVKTSMAADGITLQVNNDPAAGQIIYHLHIHVIPRSDTDGLALWPQGKYAEGEAEKITEDIKKAF